MPSKVVVMPQPAHNVDEKRWRRSVLSRHLDLMTSRMGMKRSREAIHLMRYDRGDEQNITS